jgi:hypothetical protein
MNERDEDARNWALVRAPLGEEWSGRARYGAAVYLYNRGEMSPEVLEVYRICSRLDAEDPLAIIRDRGIGADWMAKV